MDVKSAELTDLEFYPIFENNLTEDSIKDFYKENIDGNWKINFDEFKSKYSELVEPILYADFLILLKFEKKKYADFFNIKKKPVNFALERLFAPFVLKLCLKLINLEDQEIETKVELTFKYYSNDALIVNKLDSKDLILDDPFTFHDYVLVLPKDTNNGKKLIK